MTVAEAIKWMKDGATPYFEDSADKFCEAYDMAIRSLEAWKNVLDEINGIEIDRNASWYVFYQKTLEIIDKHLNEIIISKHTEHNCCYWNNGCTIGNHPCTDNYDCEDFD